MAFCFLPSSPKQMQGLATRDKVPSKMYFDCPPPIPFLLIDTDGSWCYVLALGPMGICLKIAIKKTYNAEEISKGLTLSHRLVPKQLARLSKAQVSSFQHQRPGTTDPQHPEHLG